MTSSFGFLVFAVFACACYIAYLQFDRKALIKQVLNVKALFNEQVKSGVMQDLQLATSEQLMEEIKRRNEFFIMMYSKNSKDQDIDGMEMLVCGLSPLKTITTLQTSARLLKMQVVQAQLQDQFCNADADDLDDEEIDHFDEE